MNPSTLGSSRRSSLPGACTCPLTPPHVIRVDYERLGGVPALLNDEAERVAAALKAVEAQATLLRAGWDGPAADVFFASMDSDIRPGLARVVAALLLTAEFTDLLVTIYDEAERQAAQIDWSGGGAKATQPPDAMPTLTVAGGGVLGLVLPRFVDDPLLTRATFLNDLALGVPLTAAGGLLTRVQSDEDGPITLLPSMGAGGRPSGQGQVGGAAPPSGTGPVQQPPTSRGAVGGQSSSTPIQRPMFASRINMRHILRKHGFRPGRVSTRNRTLFPEGWSEAEIEAAIDDVMMNNEPQSGLRIMESGKRYLVYRGEHNGLLIEVKYNVDTGVIDTAYPVHRE